MGVFIVIALSAGPYCRLCEEDYYKTVTEACAICETNASSWAIFAATIVFLVLIGFVGRKLYRKATTRSRRRIKALGKIMSVY